MAGYESPRQDWMKKTNDMTKEKSMHQPALPSLLLTAFQIFLAIGDANHQPQQTASHYMPR